VGAPISVGAHEFRRGSTGALWQEFVRFGSNENALVRTRSVQERREASL
jgi:hypothetical protein